MRPKNVTKENRRFVHGAMIINAPSASLNLGEEGIKRVFTKGQDGNPIAFSYLSGQFIKAKIKETLIEKGEDLSKPEIIKVSGKKDTPTASCDPFKYLDDDLFGYMNIIKDSKHKNPDTTRVAPFKISYFLGKEGDFQKDYAIKKRMDKDEKTGEIVEIKPHVLNDNNRLFASTSYSGCFSIDINFAGRFFKGNTAGFKNLSHKFPIDEYKDFLEYSDEFEFVLKKDIRKERIQKLLKSFPYLSGGARQATVFADLAPKFVVYCVTDSGNHLFQEISSVYEHFNVKSLIEAVTDFKDNLKSDIYIALKNGFLENKRREILEGIIKYNNGINENGFKFVYLGSNDKGKDKEQLSGINEITTKFADEVIPDIFNIENI